MSVMEKTFTDVKPGGRGYPTDCLARYRVAIIIPFRDRPQHLQTLLYNLHPMLLRQQIDYQIFIVEQKGKSACASFKRTRFSCFFFIEKCFCTGCSFVNERKYLIRVSGNEAFNRAMLMNVGYVEALKERPFDCFIFHDVDLLPEDDRNLYTCPEQPRHMSVAVDKFKYRYQEELPMFFAGCIVFRYPYATHKVIGVVSA